MTWAVVPAAGQGARFGGDVPKQYLEVAGEPLLAHSLRALFAHPGVAGAVVVLAPGDTRWQGWSDPAGRPVIACTGGDTRARRCWRAWARSPKACARMPSCWCTTPRGRTCAGPICALLERGREDPVGAIWPPGARYPEGAGDDGGSTPPSRASACGVR